MKKLNKIFILLALLSFVSCGTASVASSSDSEKPEGSSDQVNDQTESASENADGSEKQPETASDSIAASAETNETGEVKEEKNPNYDGGKYIGPAAADFEESFSPAYSTFDALSCALERERALQELYL